ncbi:MAG: Lrp/AsnC family transcriptional regulator [Dehalococcoidia bacterium]|nr:Lrp/AsnC family transcriptional regulator [Dehalococcoidia bacterium]
MKEILRILEKDARLTPHQVAVMTGNSEAAVENIISEAERDRVILRYKTVVDWEKLGEELVWALVEVKVTPQRDVGFDAIAARIYRFPEARSVYLVSGGFDLSVIVEGKTMREVASFISEKLAPIEGVQGTVTHFLLKRYKEDGQVFGDGGEERKRLQVSP